LQAPLAEQTGRDGGVVVGCDIPVIGRFYYQAIVTGGAERRREKSRFALVVEREVEERQIEYGDILEKDRRVAGRADLSDAVQLQFLGAQEPVVVARRASRILGVKQPLLVGPLELQPCRAAARRAAPVQFFGEIELRLLHISFVGLYI
jgi:hypothetical protein